MSSLIIWRGLLATDLVHAAGIPHFTLAELMGMMVDAPAGQVQFVERKFINLLKEPLVVSGTLNFQRPSRLEKITLKPSKERYLVEGDAVTIDNEETNLHQRLNLSSYPELHAFVESIRAPLVGDQETLERFYRVSLGGTRKNWLMALVPKESEMAKLVRMVQVKGRGDSIYEIRIDESGGDSSVMTLVPIR